MRTLFAVFCLFTALLGTAARAVPLLETKLAACQILLGAGALANPGRGEVGVSQALRLNVLLGKLSPEQRAKLYEAADGDGLQDLLHALRTDQLSPAQRELFKKQPGLEIAVQDLAELGDSFPGIFALSNADAVIMKVLEVVRRQEMQSKVSNADLLQSQSMAPRLKRTIDHTLINLVQQATMEYEGQRFNKTGFQFFWYKLGRFIFPSYQKVKDVIDHAHNAERQLTRLQMVDRLIINLGLAEANALQLTDEEIQKLTFQVLNSPDEIDSIEKSMRKLFGRGFKVGSGVDIGKFDVNAAAKQANKHDTGLLNEEFDKANLLALETLNEQLNQSRARKGLGKRQVRDFHVNELQLYLEAQLRRVDLYESFYENFTAQDTKDGYEVEEAYTVTELDGVDDKGRPKFKTVTKYRWVDVTPSFEAVLSGDYDTGDRGVSGLEAVKARAAAVKKKEAKARNALAKGEETINAVLNGYTDAVMKGVKREKFMEEMKKYEEVLAQLESEQKEYLKWSDRQILDQYSMDKAQNFRDRNAWILERLINMKRLFQQLQELMRRGQLQLTPVFDLVDYTNWLSTLKSYRDWNYARKTAMGLGAAGALGSYLGVPEFQILVDQWIHLLRDGAKNLIP